MVTSSSSEGWSATASMFSGRPDPTWSVRSEDVERLIQSWERLVIVSKTQQPTPPALGYRGCTLRAPDGRAWHAFGGLVVLRTPEQQQTRRDADGTFENALLATAPHGTIPRP
jgi:hypothetical protein